MEKLLAGIVKFRRDDFEEHKKLFTSLKETHKPHTLFISCSDSRVDPNMITKTLPGELFIIRNIANLVPKYRSTDEFVATTSAIEYAVLSLNVEHIIVCGHSNCGGIEAALGPKDELKEMPNVQKWLELTNPVKERVLKAIPEDEPEAREWMMEQANVIEQLQHLLSYPYISEKIKMGGLTLAGWYYIIETGEVFIYNEDLETFILAN